MDLHLDSPIRAPQRPYHPPRPNSELESSITPQRPARPSARVRLGATAALLALLVAVPAAHAQSFTLLTSNFDSNTLAGTTASGLKWSTAPSVAMLNSGIVTSLNSYSFSVLGSQSTSNNLAINSNLNAAGQTATQRGFSASFLVSNGCVLGDLTVRAGLVSGVGTKQTGTATLNYRVIKLADTSIVASGSQSFDHAGTNVVFDRVFTLSGDLEAGASYALEVGMNQLVSGSAFALYDGVTLGAYPVPGSNPDFAWRRNLAKFQRATANVVGSSYTADLAVDGIVDNYHSWRVGNTTGPHWLEITYPRPVTLGSAHLYSGLPLATTSQVWLNYRLQYHNGSGWVDIPGSSVTSGTASPERSILFSSPVTSDRFRLLGNEAVVDRAVRELALFPPNPNGGGIEQGFPFGTDVNVNLALKRPTVASSIDGTRHAIKATDGYVDDNSRWLCNPSIPDQTLEIDLLSDHAIGSAHLHSGFYAGSNNMLANFVLQYSNSASSTWVPIPGATVTGNTDMARIIAFSTNVTTSRVRLIASSNSYARVAELLLFPPRSGGYPLGQDIRYEPPPAATWEDFSDASHRIRVQPTPDRRLALINGIATFADDSAGASALDWQILLNHRDGSYRIRHVATGHCLSLADIATATNTAVIAEPYTGMPHQNWFLDYVSTTRFRILNAYSGLALQSLNANPAAGTPLVVAPPSTSSLQRWDAARQTHHPKKGLAFTVGTPTFPVPSNTTWHSYYYTNIHSALWSYTWGRQLTNSFPYIDDNHTYNPMIWGNGNFVHGTIPGVNESIYNNLQSSAKPASLMGFNEPDKTDQSNVPVEDGIARWPRFMSMDVPLVSHAPASHNTNTGWLAEFYDAVDALGYRVDYTAIHVYDQPNPTRLINRIKDVYNTWKRPVWLTEFSTVRWDTNGPTWTDASNFNFLAEFMWQAESLPELHRYSFFFYREGASATSPDPVDAPRGNATRSNGTLTALGELYAGWDGVTAVVTNKSYHLHNRKEYRRVQNPGTNPPPTDAITSVSPEVSTSGNQWFLIAGTTSNTVRIVSTLDGRRVRYFTGTNVGMVAANNFTGQSEWRLVPAEHGWYFLEHPQSAASPIRLRMNSSGTPIHGSVSGTTDEYKWRFVVPAESQPLAPDAPMVTAQGGVQQIALSWNVVDRATAYSVERFNATGLTWQSLVTGLTGTAWTNTGLPSAATYTYRVLATNILGNSSPSAPAAATTLHPFSTYPAWQAEYLASQAFAEQAAGADPNNNGIVNLQEYAHARNPLSPGSNPFTITQSGSNAVTLEFPWNWRASDIAWRVRRGTQLSNIASWPVADSNSVQIIRDADVDIVRLTYPTTNSPQAFFILEVVSPP
jgi:hypothetical protein